MAVKFNYLAKVRNQEWSALAATKWLCWSLWAAAHHPTNSSKDSGQERTLMCNAIAFSMRKWCNLADLEVHPHRLRDSLATHAVSGGVDVFTLQNTLGYSSSVTTGYYISASPEDSS